MATWDGRDPAACWEEGGAECVVGTPWLSGLHTAVARQAPHESVERVPSKSLVCEAATIHNGHPQRGSVVGVLGRAGVRARVDRTTLPREKDW